MAKQKTFLEELADYGWGQEGVDTGGAANAQGLAEHKARNTTPKVNTPIWRSRKTRTSPIKTTGPFAHYVRKDEPANLKARPKSGTERRIEAFLQNAKVIVGGLFVWIMVAAFIAQLFGVLP